MRNRIGVLLLVATMAACGGGGDGGDGGEAESREFDQRAFCDKEDELDQALESRDPTSQDIQALANLAPERYDDEFQDFLEAIGRIEAADTEEERTEAEQQNADDEEFAASLETLVDFIDETCGTD